MKKRIIAAAIAVCMTATMVGGCGATNDTHAQDGTVSRMERYDPWCGGVYVWTDPDTNVQYLVCQDYRRAVYWMAAAVLNAAVTF